MTRARINRTELPFNIRVLANPDKGVGKQLTREVVRVLEDVYAASQMEDAKFADDPAEDARIKDTVRLYMDSYITGPVDTAITALRVAAGVPRTD